MRKNEHEEFIRSEFNKFGSKYDIRQVFEDFIICGAYAISNRCYYRENIEQSYLQIAKKYTGEELKRFGEMLAHLQLECMEEEPEDILGTIYEEIGMSNKQKGQFFTPKSICDMSARMTVDSNEAKKHIEEDGYTSVIDQACGSGRMLFSVIDHLQRENVDIDKVFIEGDDVSLLCCCMTYLTLSLRGVSGIVRHQDSLTLQHWNDFYTPSYVVNKELQNNMKKDKEGIEV